MRRRKTLKIFSSFSLFETGFPMLGNGASRPCTVSRNFTSTTRQEQTHNYNCRHYQGNPETLVFTFVAASKSLA